MEIEFHYLMTLMIKKKCRDFTTLILLLVLASSACSNSPKANVEVAAVSVSYGKPIELAKEEFEPDGWTVNPDYQNYKTI